MASTTCRGCRKSNNLMRIQPAKLGSHAVLVGTQYDREHSSRCREDSLRPRFRQDPRKKAAFSISTKTNLLLRKEISETMRSLLVKVAAVLSLGCLAFAATPLTVANLRCKYKTTPVGIDLLQPRLSWELLSSQRATLQTAYQVRVAVSPSGLAKNGLVWDSGKQSSDLSIQVPYQGPALATGARYYWQGQGGGNHGHASGWRTPEVWEV